MYKFRKAIWHSLDLDKIYNCTRRSKEEALEIGLQTEYNAPASHGISCFCCGKIITESTTRPTLERERNE